jgi:hypothetical protein
MAVGMMFRAGGRNVTSSQVEGMMRRFQAAAKSEEGKASGVDAGTLKDIVTDGTASKDADVSIVDWYRSLGLTVTPFGDKEGGFEAFLVESKHDANTQGVMQAFYVMPDPRFAVAGFLSQRGGTNVTGLQIANMKMRAAEKARNDDGPKGSKVAPGVLSPSVPQVPVERIIEETSPLAKAPAEVSGAEALARKPAGAPPWQPAPADQGPQTGPVASQPAPQAAVRPELPELPLSTLSAAASDPYRSKIDKATFTEALKTSIWFQVGAPEAPMIYMIVDPQCPFCHATWQKIKPFVFARKLQVRIVMIAGLKGSYPLAVSILSRPGDGAASAWLSGEGSMHDVPVRQGPIPGSGDWDRVAKMLQINTHFIDRFAIDRTPFISYQSMDGTLYTSLGLPQDLNAFFAALQSR